MPPMKHGPLHLSGSSTVKPRSGAGNPSHGISQGLTLTMAVATGVAVANIYYNQPMLGMIERDLPGTTSALIPTATQLGYALGLFFIVPLGDLLERRRLIALQFVVLAVALVATAIAPTAGLVVVASLLVGVSATVAQQIVPFAANLAAPEKRGATVGIVMSGLLTGILLSRTLAGVVATHAGWRAMFWLGVPLALIAALVMALRLPESRSDTKASYPEIMASLVDLWHELPELRLAAATQALLFAAFTTFWTILSLHLEEPRFGLGAGIAGLFGVLGATGVLAAPIAGKVADRRGPHLVIMLGSILATIAWLVFGLWTSVAGLILGVLLLDLAVHGVAVSNQHVVYALRPEARSRLNTIFMGCMFLGGAVGSSLVTLAWKFGGWDVVSVLGATFAGLAVVLQIVAGVRIQLPHRQSA